MPEHPQASASRLRILTKKDLQKKVPYTPQHILRLEKAGKFPKRVQLGANRVGWIEHEIDTWIENLMQARSHEVAPETPRNDSVGAGEPQADALPARSNETFVTVAQLMGEFKCPPSQIEWYEETQRLPPRRVLADGRQGWYASDLNL